MSEDFYDRVESAKQYLENVKQHLSFLENSLPINLESYRRFRYSEESGLGEMCIDLEEDLE